MIFLFFAVLLAAYAFLNLADSALAESRPARLEAEALGGLDRAKAALSLFHAPARLLATIRLGLLSLAVLAGVVAHARLAGAVAHWLGGGPWAGHAAAGLAVAGLSAVGVVAGDLIPRRLGAIYPEHTLAVLARPLRAIVLVAAPFTGLLDSIAALTVTLLGLKPHAEAPVTDDEIRVLMDEGTKAGVFNKAENDIVSNVLRLADRRASALMTPRNDIAWIEQDATQDEIRAIMAERPHSFYPVATGNLDQVTGVLAGKDCLARAFAGLPIDLEDLMGKPLVVPERVSALQVLESFRNNPQQVALIADEYGGILGMVSQDDILEAVVGVLPSAAQPGGDDPPAVQRADGSWLIDGGMAADEFKRLLGRRELPGESEYDTVGGFVLMQLQRIPRAADTFTWDGLTVEVMDMDGKRVDKVLVAPAAP